MSTPAAPEIDDASPPDWADEAEQRVLNNALVLAETLPWTAALVLRAAERAGLSPADADLLLPDGPADLAALLSRRHDRLAWSAAVWAPSLEHDRRKWIPVPPPVMF